MEKFTKITVGFVTQSYEKNAAGKFICTGQEFIAGDQVDYENLDGDTITPPEHDYQPFSMSLLDGAEIATNQPMETKLGFLEAQLLEACKVITSYTTDLLHRLDDQVNIGDVDELQQAKDVIGRYANLATQSDKLLIECFVSEQCSDVPDKKLPVNIMAESGKLWVQPLGYGDKTSTDGHGWPISLEIWDGRLRLIIFGNINVEEPQIIDLEKARETVRMRCNWCDKEVGIESVKWKGLLFCDEPCLDACRAAQ
jgi:hypothetical protein